MSIKDEEKLLEYRIGELESNFKELRGDVKQIKEAVLRWDTKLGSADYFQCPVHKIALEQLKSDQETTKKDVETLKIFKWKAVGAIAVGMLVIQIFGGTIARAVFPEKTITNHQKTELPYPTSATNSFGYFNK